MSTGGPADYLEVHVDSDNEITSIVYHFADWFDHAEQELSGEEFDVAEQFARHLLPDLY